MAFEILGLVVALLAAALLLFAASAGVGLLLGRAGLREPKERVSPPPGASDPHVLG